MKTRAFDSGMLLLSLLAAGWAGGGTAQARDLELKPTVSVGEEYTDNVFETADGRKTEFITRVRPGGVLSYRMPRILLNGAYNFDYRHYARGVHDDEQHHNADVKGNAELIENLLYLDLSDTLRRTTVDVSRDVESESLLTNQTTQNQAAVSPYLFWRPSDMSSLRTGYRYADTRYFEGAGYDKKEHGAFADLEHRLSGKTTLYAGYTFTHGKTWILDYDRHDASGGFKYLYADNSFIFARIGNSWHSFMGGATRSNLFWDAGVSHDFKVATALVETKVQNTENPLSVSTRQVSYSARIDKPFSRGALGLSGSYVEYFDIETDTLDKRRATVAGTGRYDLTPALIFTATVSGDRFSQKSDATYPYRLTAATGINYRFFNDNTALSLSYTYRTDRLEIGDSRNEKLTNRVLLEIKAGL